jgi:hypothetical protein
VVKSLVRKPGSFRSPAIAAAAITVAAATTASAAAAAATATAAAATAAAAATTAEAAAAAAATTAAAAAAEATAATAAAALGTFLSLVDAQRTTVEVRAVHGRDGSLCLLLVGHRDETEAARATGFAIGHDVRVSDLARAGECLAQNVRGGVKREIADVEAIAHLLFSRSLRLS